ncbi:MAG TPA: heme-binding protein [Steroidobacteraceae bacterium]|nr:heme-binding protein [Steroidobacteraceae bacterium]
MSAMRALAPIALALQVAGCGGGGTASSPPGAVDPPPAGCDGSCAGPASFLSVGEVETVVARAVAEAQAQGAAATIAVVDRVGNVLAVFRMTGAATTVTVQSNGASGGLEGVSIVPDTMAAIAKAVTAAYLSTEGHAFGTRTASQIVQEHFNPGEALAPAGPLFGVQFSQLPCSDLSARFAGGAADAGPKRSPLGLAADPGGLPLYKGGTPVGGVGVIADGVYGLDANVQDTDADLDELVALAGTFGLAAPDDRRAERISADGKLLRLADAQFSDLVADTGAPPAFAAINGVAGVLVAVPGYAAASVIAGTAFGQPASGIRPDALDYPGLGAFVLVDAADSERFRPIAGTDGPDALAAAEVRTIIAEALRVAARTRAQIRRPLGGPARVTVSVVDTNGAILGVARGRDGPVFGIDVSVQKARSAAFFSSAAAAAALAGAADAVYLDGGLVALRNESIGQYVTALRAFTGLPNALADGAIAFSTRAVGNLARPFYPDGVDAAPAGPLAKPAGEWTPFSTGLQLDLAHNAIIQHVAFVAGLAPDVPQNCTGVQGFNLGFGAGGSFAQLANGLQIFPGGEPIYRGGMLVGAIGVSGDGVDQDDMIGFLGVHEASALLGGAIGNAPVAIRADTLAPAGNRLRYVNCPQAPFTDSNAEGVCEGK